MYQTSILGIIIDDKEEAFEHICNNICSWCLDQDNLYKFLKSAILSLKMSKGIESLPQTLNF